MPYHSIIPSSKDICIGGEKRVQAGTDFEYIKWLDIIKQNFERFLAYRISYVCLFSSSLLLVADTTTTTTTATTATTTSSTTAAATGKCQ